MAPVRILIVADSLSREREVRELLSNEQGLRWSLPMGMGCLRMFCWWRVHDPKTCQQIAMSFT